MLRSTRRSAVVQVSFTADEISRMIPWTNSKNQIIDVHAPVAMHKMYRLQSVRVRRCPLCTQGPRPGQTHNGGTMYSETRPEALRSKIMSRHEDTHAHNLQYTHVCKSCKHLQLVVYI